MAGSGRAATNGDGAAAGKKKRLTRNQKRRLKKKRAKARAAEAAKADTTAPNAPDKAASVDATTEAAPAPAPSQPDVVIEYVSENLLDGFLAQQRAALGLPPKPAAEDTPATESKGEEDAGEGSDPQPDADPVSAFAEEFGKVFARFSTAEELVGTAVAEEAEDASGDGGDVAEANADDAEEEGPSKPLSRRQRKKLHRLSVAQLKQLVKRPDVVEAHDVTSSDPRYLVFLKAYRNTVPVPRHWSAKRKYLQGKRGIERPPFQLPDFISDTGITKLRDARQEEDDKKTTKQRQREKVQPKMGKINIDYQVLHDAFFKFQTKPPFTQHGDLYYEGKEFEVNMKHKTPGVLSEALKQALGMPEGAPPPWLITMQRYGPPPAYPSLKIPGLNAPIPEGASFGYHPGGWGRPPVDEQGRPLYGDVFGTGVVEEEEVVDRTLWGEMLEEEEEESDEELDEESDGEGEEDEGTATVVDDGTTTVASGLSTPATIDLRKGLRKYVLPVLRSIPCVWCVCGGGGGDQRRAP